jgi:transposase
VAEQEEVLVGKAWVGVDAGKGRHWAVALDADGEVLFSREVGNDEGDLSALLEEGLSLASDLTWAIDQPGGTAALLLTLLWERGQEVLYVPGIAVDRARDAYRGEAKTDAKDARLIADQARMRKDLGPLRPADELLVELRLLTAHRRDLVADRTRAISRLRDILASSFPALERALDPRSKGALVLLERYQTPDALRRSGRKRVEAYLRKRGVRNAPRLAEVALAAANSQRVRVPGQELAARILSRIAGELITLNGRIDALEEELVEAFSSHPLSEILVSLPGMGPRLGAEFLVAVGDPSAFATAGHLAAYAGLVPAARDSGKRVGNHRRMSGGNKVLKRVFYQSAFASLRTPHSRGFYERKRGEGKRHHQAVIALARRRVDVLFAMLRDGERFRPPRAA